MAATLICHAKLWDLVCGCMASESSERSQGKKGVVKAKHRDLAVCKTESDKGDPYTDRAGMWRR